MRKGREAEIANNERYHHVCLFFWHTKHNALFHVAHPHNYREKSLFLCKYEQSDDFPCECIGEVKNIQQQQGR
jgi:hypothetical protein